MSALSFLLLILAPLGLATTAYVVWPLLRRRAASVSPDDVAARLNREIVAERRAQLDRELAALPPGSPDRERLVREFTTTALEDLAPARGPRPEPGRAASRPAGRAEAGAARAGGRWVAAALLAAVMVTGPIAFYRIAGLPEAAEPDFARRAATPTLPGMIAELEQRLAADPGAAEGWLLLGRARLAQGEQAAAIAALEKALALPATDPPLSAQIRADLADAVAQRSAQRLDGRPWTLIQEALRFDPSNQKALALAGAYRVTRNDAAGALRYWEPLLAQLPPGTEQHGQIAGFVADLRAGRRPGGGPLGQPEVSTEAPVASTEAPTEAPTAAAAPASPPGASALSAPPAAAVPPIASGGPGAPAGAQLRGRIEIDPALDPVPAPDTTVFVAVRGVDSAGQPVGPPAAVRRIRVADLPYAFALGDADAMGPMARLSAQTRVVVVARVSVSGSPTPRSGDLEGRSAVVAPDAADVRVRIDRALP